MLLKRCCLACSDRWCLIYLWWLSKDVSIFFFFFFCRNNNDPVTGKPLSCKDLTPDKNMKKSVVEYRTSQIVETDP